MAKKPKYTAEGKDYDGSKFIDADLSFDLPEPTAKRAGMPVSTRAFKELKKKYNPPVGDTEAVIFDRESILTILSQYGCAGIMFHFVKKPTSAGDRLSLAMVGVDSNYQELSITTTTGSRDPLYYEWTDCVPPCP
jgi:hypothetical protein